jgi:hypothetical protein
MAHNHGAMRRLFIHGTREFQARSGAGYPHLSESYPVTPHGVDAEEELIGLWVLMQGRGDSPLSVFLAPITETGELVPSVICPLYQ